MFLLNIFIGFCVIQSQIYYIFLKEQRRDKNFCSIVIFIAIYICAKCIFLLTLHAND